MKILLRILPVSLLMPLFTFAQTSQAGNFRGFSAFINNILNFVNTVLIPAVFGLALLVFIWGMFTTFILGGHDEEKQAAGKSLMLYAIAGFVIMVSLWGIVNFIASSLGFAGEGLRGIPVVPTR